MPRQEEAQCVGAAGTEPNTKTSVHTTLSLTPRLLGRKENLVHISHGLCIYNFPKSWVGGGIRTS